MIEDSVTRFKGAPWFDEVQKHRIMFAGLGGIGTWAAILMSRLRPKCINLLDPDLVSSVNLAGQLFLTEDVGDYKAQAVTQLIKKFSAYYDVNYQFMSLDQHTVIQPVLICGFDNMSARRTAYGLWKKSVQATAPEKRDKFLLIDGRMSAEVIQVFCLTGDNPDNWTKYEKDWLFSDNEAESTVCSYKQTTFCASMIGSLIVNLYVNWCANKSSDSFRALPFMIQYDAPFTYFKTED